ncbi:hypothetical protein POTOM_051257 [Populus tomentosa]|uniref:Uncharacterized protein n=1 Tax=Populus tomentosa TaxID=118781 RepID=A0A8X8C832_POPTO|nr:hypothetical protein POTOM_051257 [Populus tomentosa]
MCFFLPGNYLKFYDAKRSAYPDIKIISNCDGPSHSLDRPADYYDFHASVGDYAVTGNDVGTGSLLAALADAGFLIGLKRNSEVNLKVSIDGLGLNSQLSGSTKTVLTSSNVMDENSFVDPIKLVPAQTTLENADKDNDVVLPPYS